MDTKYKVLQKRINSTNDLKQKKMLLKNVMKMYSSVPESWIHYITHLLSENTKDEIPDSIKDLISKAFSLHKNNSIIQELYSSRVSKIKIKPLVETFSEIYPEELLKLIKKECHKLDNISIGLPDGKRATFWMGAKQEPRFAMEEFVKHISKIDYPNGLEEEGIVGFEWWTQIRKPSENITFHFDKDEGLASNSKIFKFPHRGTVTYLTQCGGPTMVFDHRTTDKNNAYTPSVPRDGFISMPTIGKHITFDGELFHGVVGSMNSINKETKRITFLVNYWKYKPEEPNCTLFPYPEKMGSLAESQKKKLYDHIKNVKSDKIIPLERHDNESIHPIKRGYQSFYMPFPHVPNNKTFSFEQKGGIPSGFLNIQKRKDSISKIDISFKFNYSSDWYWTYTIDKSMPVSLTSFENNTTATLKKGNHKILIKAFDSKNEIIAQESKTISIGRNARNNNGPAW